MRFTSSVVAAALACAAPLAAQDVPRGPRLMQVAASSGGTVLSLDSSTVARSGDSTFVADAVYQFPVDTAQQVPADRRVDSQVIDCAKMRLRGRHTMYFRGDPPMPLPTADTAKPSTRWEDVGDDERPIAEALCRFLLSSFASLPVTREAPSVDEPPEMANRGEVARTLARGYPTTARDAGAGGQVMLRFQIAADGQVEMSTVRTLWAPRRDLADAALRVVRTMRFRPARDHGTPVAVWATIPVSFWVDK